MTQITTGCYLGVVTHLEPDNLKCEVKWALGLAFLWTNLEDRIPAELFIILKDDAVKVMPSIHQEIWKPAAATELEKVSFSFQSQRKAMSKNV